MLLLKGNESDSTISPFVPDHEWPMIARLIFVVTSTIYAVITNIFFVAAFFIEKRLQRPGLSFLACIGIADLFISCGVMPLVAMELLSGERNITICNFLHFLTVTSTYAYSMSFTFASLSDYYRLGLNQKESMCTRTAVSLVAASIYCFSIIAAAVGVYGGLDFDYCNLTHNGHLAFRITTDLLCHVIPGLFSIIFLTSSFSSIENHAAKVKKYRRSRYYDSDRCMVTLNLCVFLLYVVSWIPYLAITYEVSISSRSSFYNSVWLAICRTLISSSLYLVLNPYFKKAFKNLFNYCFCRTSMSTSPRPRETEVRLRTIQTHILQQVVPCNSPNKPSTSSL